MCVCVGGGGCYLVFEGGEIFDPNIRTKSEEFGWQWFALMHTGRPRKKLVSELLNSIKGALLCWMFKFSNALLCWMIGRWWLWRFSMTNFVLPKNCQKMPKCENVKFWIPSQWHSDCVQNFWGRPKSKIGRPVPFWKFQILGCWWWRELLSCVG